jgi:hypothetical protein
MHSAEERKLSKSETGDKFRSWELDQPHSPAHLWSGLRLAGAHKADGVVQACWKLHGLAACCVP